VYTFSRGKKQTQKKTKNKQTDKKTPLSGANRLNTI
jgi:hypothetical protein